MLCASANLSNIIQLYFPAECFTTIWGGNFGGGEWVRFTSKWHHNWFLPVILSAVQSRGHVSSMDPKDMEKLWGKPQPFLGQMKIYSKSATKIIATMTKSCARGHVLQYLLLSSLLNTWNLLLVFVCSKFVIRIIALKDLMFKNRCEL